MTYDHRAHPAEAGPRVYAFLRKIIMEIELQADPDKLIQKFSGLESRADVAELLEVSESFLCKILYGINERNRYKIFEIQKKSKKTRQISAPPKNIAILQSKLNTILKLIYEPKYCVHGFVVDRNILSNSEKHTSKKHVINIDLKDFFPSIHVGRIKGALMSRPFCVGNEAAVVISQICCRFDGILPQGGATSPIISNIICRSLDNDIMSFARNNRCQYTRYADDITISTSSFHLPKELATLNNGDLILGVKLVSIITKHNFQINPDKIRYTNPFLRQDVTGLTVNDFPNIRRSYIKSMLGALHAWEKYGYQAANKKYLSKYQPRDHSGFDLDNVLRGKIAFTKMILGDNSPIFRKLARRYNRLAPNKITITPIQKMEPYPLRGNEPSKQVWNKWFNKYMKSIFFIEINNDKGDKFAGTAFYIGKNLFGTAGHNLKYKNAQMYFGDSPRLIDKFTAYDEKSIDVGVISIDDKGNAELDWLPTQLRLPEIGEEVAAIGFPYLPQRRPTLVMHVGVVEALPVTLDSRQRLIQVSFQSGGGLSGGCLIDKRGFVIGIMIENIYNMGANNIPNRPYGQAVPVECLADKLA
jgi:RNA-directed DNA polymerase